MLHSHVDVCCLWEGHAGFIKVDVRDSRFFARLCSITSLDFITSQLAIQMSVGSVEANYNILHHMNTETTCSHLDHVSPSHGPQPYL
jgi:hypothetical protein